MRFAIYGRKSIASDRSDSVDNQFKMCEDYINLKFPGQAENIEHYSDEDKTGANTKRPDLQRLIADVEDGQVNVLVVYQLDRLSRNIRDFSNIYALLDEHKVTFVSLRENIDTATPIGTAMMYIAVVFAQMERETTAARVTDNMIGLAKKGYWTGGNPPVGYVREKISVGGKNHVMIVPDPDGVAYVCKIFDYFLDGKYSLQGMETSLRHRGIRTRAGGFFSTTQIYQILTSPFCVPALPEIYDYYASKGCQMATPRESWDGTHGVMVYGRTTQPKDGKHQKQPPEKWVVCVGLHKPFLSADKWLAAQSRLSGNKFDKNAKYDIPLLKGVLRCKCGVLMAVSRKKCLNGVSSWYYCLKRNRQGVETCDMRQIKIDVLDQKVLNIFREIATDPAQIKKYAASTSSSAPIDINSISAQIRQIEDKIGRLAASLALAEDSTASKYIVAEIERLDLNLQALNREKGLAAAQLRKQRSAVKNAEATAAEITRLIQGLNTFTAAERNEIVRSVVKECVWDGTELKIVL